MKYDIFISYRRAGGKHFARTLKETLSKKGYSVFLDLDELKDGHFMDAIYSAMDSSKVFFLIMSPDVFERCSEPEDHVRNEIQHALQRGMNIVPVVFDNHIPEFPEDVPGDIKMGIRSIQYSFLDTEHFFGESVDKLIEERVETGSNKAAHHLNRWKWISLPVALLMIAAAVLIVNKIRTPEYFITRADKLAGNEILQKTYEQLQSEVSASKCKRIARLYRKGAMGHISTAQTELDLYNQDGDVTNLNDAHYDFHNAGHAFDSMGEYEQAAEYYSMAVSCEMKSYAIKNDPEILSRIVYSLNNLAYCYGHLGNEKKALETINKAIELIPGDINSYDSKGEILFMIGKYSEALDVWHQIEVQDPFFKAQPWVKQCEGKLER